MFAKLFSSITESSLWSEPKEVRLLFVTMLAKADQNGFVEASIPGLARVANLTVEETETGLQCLESPDVYSKNPDNEGRRVLQVPGGFVLLNYEDYRARRSTEERREYMRDYMQNYRKKSNNGKHGVNSGKRAVNNGKPRLAQADTDTEEETKTEEFDSFWCVYPRKTAKGTARKAFKAAMKKTSAVQIIAAAAAYAKSVETADPKFIAHPASWLNAERWDDETTPAAVNGSASIEDDWDEVKAIVLEKYHPDVRCTKRIEQLLTPEQFKAVIEVSPRKIWDSDRFDKVIPAAYRRARKAQQNG